MYAALDMLIRLLLYAMVGFGAIFLFRGVWVSAYQSVRKMYYGVNQRRFMRSKGLLSRTQAATRTTNAQVFTVQRHLENLLQATIKNQRGHRISTFINLSLGFGVVVYLLFVSVSRRFDFAILPALITVFVPYVVLLIRKYQIGIRNSYDIALVLDALIPEYRKARKSMINALVETVKHLPDAPIRRALGRLASRLSNYQTQEDARDALDRFTQQLGTTWAITLANDIEHAIVDGVNVEESLVDTHTEMKEIRDAMKSGKLLRLDSLLVAIVPFFVWPLMMFYFYLKVTRNIFEYQFQSAQGFQWFVITLIAAFGGFLIGIIFYRPKQDV